MTVCAPNGSTVITGNGGAADNTRLMRPYQSKLKESLEERWGGIRPAIPDSSRTLLDVGANLGAFTARAAEAGFWALGIERHDYLVRKARRVHRKVPHCAFMITELGPDDCAILPQFDAVLILSVYHNWYKAYGKENADLILRSLVSKSNDVTIFEGPSRLSRFGDTNLPDFIDNDEASVTQYYETLLKDVVGELASEIRPLGKTPCIGEREPYRWMFAICR